MKIIYIFKRNDYAAILAAYLHLKNKVPNKFTKPALQEMRLYYMGMDEDTTEVYLLKYHVKKSILMNILRGLGDIFNEEVKIIDLKKFDGYIAHKLYGPKVENYRKALEDYINENNI